MIVPNNQYDRLKRNNPNNLQTILVKDDLIQHTLKKKFGLLASATVVSCLLVFSNTTTQAGRLYVYKDKNGNALITDKKPKKSSPFKTQVKSVYFKDSNVHEYKNWGTSEKSVLPKYSKNRSRFDALILNAANRHRIDPALMKAIMHTESGFNPNAKSPVGAQGLMQLMPATAKRFGVKNAWNPSQNIEGSAKYLKYLTKRFKGNTSLILAGYNAGEGNVDKYGGIPPFKETRNYVKRVTSRYYNLYKNKSFISTGQSISPSELSRQVATNKITKTSRNGTHYIKTSVAKSKNHFTNADLTYNYGSNRSYQPSQSSIKKINYPAKNNGLLATNQSNIRLNDYESSAIKALNKGRGN